MTSFALVARANPVDAGRADHDVDDRREVLPEIEAVERVGLRRGPDDHADEREPEDHVRSVAVGHAQNLNSWVRAVTLPATAMTVSLGISGTSLPQAVGRPRSASPSAKVANRAAPRQEEVGAAADGHEAGHAGEPAPDRLGRDGERAAARVARRAAGRRRRSSRSNFGLSTQVCWMNSNWRAMLAHRQTKWRPRSSSLGRGRRLEQRPRSSGGPNSRPRRSRRWRLSTSIEPRCPASGRASRAGWRAGRARRSGSARPLASASW